MTHSKDATFPIVEMIQFQNSSSFNNKGKFIIIDNVSDLNLNSTNALLKSIEQPNNKVFYSSFGMNKIIGSRINIYIKKYSKNEIENIIVKIKELDFLSKNSGSNTYNFMRCLIANICNGFYE